VACARTKSVPSAATSRTVGEPADRYSRVVDSSKRRWPEIQEGIDDLAVPILQWLGEQGINAMLRVDAERSASQPKWTFAASGGSLVHGMRADGRTAAECMSFAVARLRELGIDVPS
jgi:hypothetical protein